ncbi:CidB/LrgB family autolysis modulator [Vibrio astriarenae]|uniref:CidB/LrgB family autolysis modulator n=1 Tax=Vibrio astriarenae TaxID=1481923 RepID=A0A7Z2T351_9VIBR|nr:LrgB family protein [Vibrio astriarenae]QIA63390.1 CidB/LrgB family autolysis modulator [Vibrio astriarenae]
MWFIITLMVFIIVRKVCGIIRSPLFNPLLVSLAVLIPLLVTLNVSYETYYADNQWVTWLLQPAVVALAYPLYEQLPQIRRNWKLILVSCTLGSVLSMLSTVLFALLLDVDFELLASLMGKSVTTPIAMEIASFLGGVPAIAAIMVLIAGLVGAILAYPIYRLFNIKSPISRGLTMGCVSHALGTATSAEKNTQDAAFSSLSLVICGVVTSIAAPIIMSTVIWLTTQ